MESIRSHGCFSSASHTFAPVISNKLVAGVFVFARSESSFLVNQILSRGESKITNKKRKYEEFGF